MFEKKTIPVWSKVNFLNPVELETLYNPGQLYAYAATSELEKVIVPRDIYREDIQITDPYGNKHDLNKSYVFVRPL